MYKQECRVAQTSIQIIWLAHHSSLGLGSLLAQWGWPPNKLIHTHIDLITIPTIYKHPLSNLSIDKQIKYEH